MGRGGRISNRTEFSFSKHCFGLSIDGALKRSQLHGDRDADGQSSEDLPLDWLG
jgi:hypothetical protein